jgi:DNA-binding response OmpR family regulator
MAMHAVLSVEDNPYARFEPFSAPEFLARIRAILRRCVLAQTAEGRLRIGSVSVDLTRRTARYLDGRALHFTPLEHRILETLAPHADRVVMQRTLSTQVWGPNECESASETCGGSCRSPLALLIIS